MSELITFRDISGYQLNQFKQDEPSCFNGMVRIKKYKITVEEIEEPKEILEERIQKLWDECNNHHNWLPIEAAAKMIGYKLKDK